jgi:hypothetical protein
MAWNNQIPNQRSLLSPYERQPGDWELERLFKCMDRGNDEVWKKRALTRRLSMPRQTYKFFDGSLTGSEDDNHSRSTPLFLSRCLASKTLSSSYYGNGHVSNWCADWCSKSKSSQSSSPETVVSPCCPCRVRILRNIRFFACLIVAPDLGHTSTIWPTRKVKKWSMQGYPPLLALVATIIVKTVKIGLRILSLISVTGPSSQFESAA